jgi:hypothetical protein
MIDVEFPHGEEQEICAVCRQPFDEYPSKQTKGYSNLVCRQCDQKAVDENGNEPTVGPHDGQGTNPVFIDPTVGPHDGQGTNPVFIDGHKCWRRIRFGNAFTRRDEYDCDSHAEFYCCHRDDYPDNPDKL